MTYYADYSAAQLSAAQLKAAGYAGSIRYIDDITNKNLVRPKHTTKTEYDDHVRNGLKVFLVYEVNTDDPLGGFNGGVAAARRALAGANYLGYKGVIFFCSDRWFVSPGKATITPWLFQQYLDGAASVLGKERVGAYGFSDAMDAAYGHAAVYWQCGSRSAVRNFVSLWQDNNVQPKVGGIATDRNLVLKELLVEEVDMPLNESDLSNILARVWYGPVYTPDPENKPNEHINAAQALLQVQLSVDALAKALEAATNDSNITLDAVKQVVQDAVKQNLKITGTFDVTPG